MNNDYRNKIIDECIKVVSGLTIAYPKEGNIDWDNAIAAACIELQELKEKKDE